MLCHPKAAIKGEAESGFTLLEIMLVLVILAVSSMLVAPSFFSASTLSMHDEGRRLVQVLRLAQEEALLSSQSLRVQFRRHSYAFQSADEAGVWQRMGRSPYQEHQLADGIQVLEIKPQLALEDGDDDETEGTEAVLGYLIMSGFAVGQLADIVMADARGAGGQMVVEFRPGPAGIRIKPETE